MNIVVSNSSPLIALEQIQLLDVLEHIFTSIVVPPAVAREVAPTVVLPDWAEERSLSQAVGSQILSASLGAGESEALSLALELKAAVVILDERPARRLAQALDLPVVGTLGLLLQAKKRGLISSLQPQLDALLKHDFRVSPKLYDQILKDAGE